MKKKLPTKTSFMKYKSISDDFQHTLHGEDCCKEIVKIIQDLKKDELFVNLLSIYLSINQ